MTRPGGRLVVCEFSHPTWAPFRTVYLEYLMRALPAVARAVSSSPDAYVYLAESIRAWPDQRGLADLIAARRLAAPRVAQPLRRHRRAAPRHRLTAPTQAIRHDRVRLNAQVQSGFSGLEPQSRVWTHPACPLDRSGSTVLRAT